MAIKHTFVNPKADGGDATIARPSDWNANHTIDAATITRAMIVNISTTKRLIGRNTAGAGVEEEVTATQLFDWVSSTNGVLLTRTAGTWAAAANVTIDGGDLVLADNAAPTAPAASKVKLYGRDFAGRMTAAMIDPNGLKTSLQPWFARNKIGLWTPGSGNTIVSEGVAVAAGGGTATLTARSPAGTNMFTSMRRIGIVGGAAAGNTANLVATGVVNQFWRGSSAGLGGFTIVLRFGVSDAVLVGTANMFAGLKVSAVMTDVLPSAQVNQIGIGCDNGDTTLQLYAAGAAAQARVSLGASFPVNTISTDVYELILHTPPNGADVRYRVERLNTGDVASGTISAAANLPANTLFMAPQIWRSNGGAASAASFDFMGGYFETDN